MTYREWEFVPVDKFKYMFIGALAGAFAVGAGWLVAAMIFYGP
jgi:hypothetical protein